MCRAGYRAWCCLRRTSSIARGRGGERYEPWTAYRRFLRLGGCVAKGCAALIGRPCTVLQVAQVDLNQLDAGEGSNLRAAFSPLQGMLCTPKASRVPTDY